MIEYHTEKTLAELASTDTTEKLLTVTSWNSRPAKLDLRIWKKQDGTKKPSKGVTLTDEEAQELLSALTAYFSSRSV